MYLIHVVKHYYFRRKDPSFTLNYCEEEVKYITTVKDIQNLGEEYIQVSQNSCQILLQRVILYHNHENV